MDDFFRSPANGLTSHPSNRRFLRQLFKNSAMRLGLECREEFASADGGAVDVSALMDALGLPRSSNGWARATAADLSIVAELLPDLRETLVIGWGMPPSLLNYIDDQCAVFIDLEIDPIRFTQHLRFCARTNDQTALGVLSALQVDEENAWNDAAALKGYFARRGESHLIDSRLDVGLFVGQTSIDLALVEHGRIARPVDARDRVHELAQDVDLLVVKPHPYETSTSHIVELTSGIPNIAWINDNVYAMLCADNLRFVCGLSSGTLREAEFFLKPAKYLIKADRNEKQRLPRSCSEWIAVSAAIASIEAMTGICRSDPVWARLLRAVLTPRGGPEFLPDTFREDALDHAFGVRWGLDGAQRGLPALPALQLDHDYDVGAGSPNLAWLTRGWSDPEPWGVWSDGALACIAIPLDEQISRVAGSIQLRVEGVLFNAPAAEVPSIVFTVNGQPCQASPEDGDGSQGRMVLLSTLAGPVARRILLIQLAIRNPLRPSELGQGTDDRQLGFGLRRVRVSTTPA